MTTHKDIHEKIIDLFNERRRLQEIADKRDKEALKEIQEECGRIGHLMSEQHGLLGNSTIECCVCRWIETEPMPKVLQ